MVGLSQGQSDCSKLSFLIEEGMDNECQELLGKSGNRYFYRWSLFQFITTGQMEMLTQGLCDEENNGDDGNNLTAEVEEIKAEMKKVWRKRKQWRGGAFPAVGEESLNGGQQEKKIQHAAPRLPGP